jgi:hypothetical protein
MILLLEEVITDYLKAEYLMREEQLKMSSSGTKTVRIALGQIIFVDATFKQVIRIKEMGSSTFDFSYDILAGDRSRLPFLIKNMKDPSDVKRETISVLMEGLRKD